MDIPLPDGLTYINNPNKKASSTMGFMSALDLDSQEAIHAIDQISTNFVHDWADGLAAGKTEAEIEQEHRLKMMDALGRLGWVPPTIAEEANRRVRTVIDGRADSIASTLIGVSDLLLPPSRRPLPGNDEPLAEWEIELLNAGAQEVRA